MIAEINADVTTTDIFKLQRYFTFLSTAYQRKLEQVEDGAGDAHLYLDGVRDPARSRP
ncbi:hypothetical protein [Sphingobium sp. Z007]|uniref:hypothetical protein n=1 Tax=Sphingobium sp. Z007 TaxID=627495 RepID=UPI00159619DD|nr:hypothetical protein [Sphingobium sp. Z007]